MHTSLIKLAIGVSTAGALLVPAMTVSAAGAPAQIYNSSLNIAATGNVASVGGEAYSFSEFGNEVELAGNHLGKVVVNLSSWGCQTGSWNNDNCGTVPGAKFNEPITFNIYASPPRGSNTPGALIATRTQTFAIPYRPSANFAHCTGAQAGEWWDSTLSSCFNGKLVAVTFNFPAMTLHNTDVVFGIAYNTTHYGYAPIGEGAPCFGTSGGCGYNSLNIALSQDDNSGFGGNVTTGSDRYPGTVYQNASFGGDYCDGGTAGTGTFRIDSPAPTASCWAVNNDASAPYYIPAVDIR